MPEPSSVRLAFCGFLRRVASGPVGPAEWNEFAVTHYAEPALEKARQQLVRHALLSGQCSFAPIPAGLAEIAEQLLGELVAE